MNSVENLYESVTQNLGPNNLSYWDLDEEDANHLPLPQIDGDDDVRPLEDSSRVQRREDTLTGEQDHLSDEDRSVVGGVLREVGFDALAFYKSWRFRNMSPCRGLWGIFYLEPGLRYIRQLLKTEYPGRFEMAELGYRFLFEHEFHHYIADIQTLMFEATLGHELYAPLRFRLRGHHGHLFAEEALANQRAWNWAKAQRVGVGDFAYDFMKLQPGAYARFDEPRLNLASEWAATVVDGARPGTAFRPDIAQWAFSAPENLQRRTLCPEWVIRPRNLSKLFPPLFNLPPVHQIEDSSEVEKTLMNRYQHLNKAWIATKKKLLLDCHIPGLDFKRWDGDVYSVRVDDNIRAHLRRLTGASWRAESIGPHTKMGHG